MGKISLKKICENHNLPYDPRWEEMNIEKYCKHFYADADKCYCKKIPNEYGFCGIEKRRECPYFEPEYNDDEKDLVKEVLKYMKKEWAEISKTTDIVTKEEIFKELIKRTKKKYGIKK